MVELLIEGLINTVASQFMGSFVIAPQKLSLALGLFVSRYSTLPLPGMAVY